MVLAAIEDGNLEGAKATYEAFKLEPDDFDDPYTLFIQACPIGPLELVKWIYVTLELDWSYDDIAIAAAIKHDQFEVARWLVDLGPAL